MNNVYAYYMGEGKWNVTPEPVGEHDDIDVLSLDDIRNLLELNESFTKVIEEIGTRGLPSPVLVLGDGGKTIIQTAHNSENNHYFLIMRPTKGALTNNPEVEELQEGIIGKDVNEDISQDVMQRGGAILEFVNEEAIDAMIARLNMLKEKFKV